MKTCDMIAVVRSNNLVKITYESRLTRYSTVLYLYTCMNHYSIIKIIGHYNNITYKFMPDNFIAVRQL